ncbi:MAG TPA: outer membrane protein assembly factor BamB family protein, partial [Candidatus Tripitaka californicus]|uniref:outer membrane protein assembly factor BamB family protein n=1 Tax=Candidatus Tripitaka californicus TaxID=3367616 RepID=UPI004029588D
YNTANGTVLWQDNYDREGALDDAATAVAVSGSTLYVAGHTRTTAGGYAFSVRTYNANNGTLLWENYYDREGDLNDWANAVAVRGNRMFVAGLTRTTSGGNAFTTRAHKANNGSSLWGDYYDRNTAFSDVAFSVVVGGSTVYTVGFSADSALDYAFAIRALNATNGTVLWQDNYDREEGELDDA